MKRIILALCLVAAFMATTAHAQGPKITSITSNEEVRPGKVEGEVVNQKIYVTITGTGFKAGDTDVVMTGSGPCGQDPQLSRCRIPNNTFTVTEDSGKTVMVNVEVLIGKWYSDLRLHAINQNDTHSEGFLVMKIKKE